MNWCSVQHIDFIFNLAKNNRPKAQIADKIAQASSEHAPSGLPAQHFRDCRYRELENCSAEHRVLDQVRIVPVLEPCRHLLAQRERTIGVTQK